MASSAMIYIASFIEIGSGIRKVIVGRGSTNTQTAWRSHKPTCYIGGYTALMACFLDV
jgi:hypothetical protein